MLSAAANTMLWAGGDSLLLDPFRNVCQFEAFVEPPKIGLKLARPHQMNPRQQEAKARAGR
jgi:hypothetical protein